MSRERDAGFASPSGPGDAGAFWSLPRKERARLLWAMLLVRPLPPRIAAADPAIARRVRLWTWMGYGYFAFGLWLMTEALGSTAGLLQWGYWLGVVGTLDLSALFFFLAFRARRGIRPRRTLRR